MDDLHKLADAISTTSPNVRAFAEAVAEKLQPTPPTPPTSSPKQFGFATGAGVDALNQFSSAQLADYLDRVKANGATILRYDHWDGGAGDDARDAAVAQRGIDAVVMLANGNFANAKAIAATAARHGFHKYELGNEPNINLGFWGGTVDGYVKAANAAYDAIKAADPKAVIATGGICPFGQYGSKSTDGRWDQQIFLAAMIAAGAKFDVVATHAYFFGNGATWTGALMLSKTDPSGGLAQALYLPHSIKAQLDAIGRTTTSIWFTESGAPSTGYGWTGGVTEKAQADLVAGMIAVVKAEPRVPLHCEYSAKDRASLSGGREGHFGKWRADWSPKPSAAAFEAAVSG